MDFNQQLFKKFHLELLKKLPMDDNTFVNILENLDLLPGNNGPTLRAKLTSVDKADYLLQTIKPGIDLNLPKLVKAMEEYSKGVDTPLKRLVMEMKEAGASSETTGYGGAGSGPDQSMADKKKVLGLFNQDLLKLPLDDVNFLTILGNHSLFPGDTRATLNSLTTNSKKAYYLLGEVIERKVDIYLPKLLAAMEEYSGKHDDLHVKELVGRMNKAMSGELPKQKDGPQRGKTDDKQPELSEDEIDDGDFERIHNQEDGSMFCFEKVRDEKRNAVGFIELPNKEGGTVIIGKIKIDDKDSTVLLTNYHVIIGGLTPKNNYKKAKATDIDKMKKDIEENAEGSKILLHGKTIELSNGMLIKGSSIMSPITSLDYFLMIFDEEKLKKKLDNIPTIDFDKKEEVTSSIVVTIFQYPYGGRCSSASGICKVVNQKDKAPLLVYRCATEHGSSGGLILKTVDKSDMVPVGLHRGGCVGKGGVRGYNYGSPFTEIINSIEKESHPQVPNRKIEADKEAIYAVVNTLEPK